jgi:hypothetical protein
MKTKFQAVATSTTPTLRAQFGDYSCELFAPEGTEGLSTSGSDDWKLYIIDGERTDLVFTLYGSEFQFEEGDEAFAEEVSEELFREIESAAKEAIAA